MRPCYQIGDAYKGPHQLLQENKCRFPIFRKHAQVTDTVWDDYSLHICATFTFEYKWRQVLPENPTHIKMHKKDDNKNAYIKHVKTFHMFPMAWVFARLVRWTTMSTSHFPPILRSTPNVFYIHSYCFGETKIRTALKPRRGIKLALTKTLEESINQ